MKVLISAILLALLTGCGSPPPAANAAPPVSNAPLYKKELGTGRVAGVVKFEGAAPKRTPLEVKGDPRCSALHSGPVLSESLIVNDGRVQNAIVYVKSGWERWSYPTPDGEVVVDQKHCRYTPHVVTVQTGQTIAFTNSDDLSHNVHGLPRKNPPFNFSQDENRRRSTYVFTQQEVGVRVQCDVHKWMSAFVGAFAHPFHAVTNEKGEFAIQGLLPGEYELEVWHECHIAPARVTVPQSVKVEVKDKETAGAEFVLRLVK
ncbi:MAG TPA: hypothetical protein VEJ63_03805 [Planctomycetota bacterium]|nr:hypothetical protein [Planctomycetota bacterium]